MKQLLFGILVSCSGWLSAQSIGAHLSQSEILLGQPDTLTLVIKSPSDVIDLPVFEDTLSAQLEVLSIGGWDTAFSEAGIELVAELEFTSYDTGFIVVPPIKMMVKDSVYSSFPMLLNVLGEQVDLQQNIKDIKGQKEAPITWWEITLIVLGVLLLVFVILFVRKYYLNKRLIESSEVVEEPKEDFMVVFWREYSKVEKEEKWKVDEKAYQTDVSNLLRSYVSHRYGINAMESTTTDLLEQLRLNMGDVALMEKVRFILNFSDLIKFAKAHGVQDQYKKVILDLKDIVEKTELPSG